jgi:hypothetical protein
LNGLVVVLKTLDGSVAFVLPAQAGKGEADVPLSGEVVEGQHLILGDVGDCHHRCAVLVQSQVVVVALVVEVLPA